MKRIQKGFTLIELMIVVAIIGILAAVAIPAYQDYVVKAKLSKVQSTLDPLKLAMGLYYQENGSFPIATIDSDTASADGNMWDSIGIKLTEKPNVPGEVELLTATGTTGSDMLFTMKLRNIKATTVDGLNLVLAATAGGTAITWACDATTTVTDTIAKKYFGCN